MCQGAAEQTKLCAKRHLLFQEQFSSLLLRALFGCWSHATKMVHSSQLTAVACPTLAAAV
jgi:hypothetical protein